MTLITLYQNRYAPFAKKTLKPRTASEYDRIFRTYLKPKFGTRDINTITLDEVEQLHNELADSPVMANRVVACLSAILSYAADRKLLSSANPCSGVTRYKEQPREHFYMPDECKRILAAASAWPDIRGSYIALLLLTGARPGELLDLAPSWRHGRVLRTPDGKTGARTIFLSGAASDLLSKLQPHPETGRYFPTGMDLRRAWHGILAMAGLPRARMYDLRHTFASSALAGEVPLAVIGQMLGHKKLQTTLRYSHLAPDTGLQGAEAAAARMGV